MSKIKWCCCQKNGITIIEPNERLSNEYLTHADDDLIAMINQKDKWKNIAAYYTCYEALYAILMKLGIKCEIHECTIELMTLIPEFSSGDKIFLSELKTERTDVQYYLKKPEALDEQKIKEFVLKCKTIILKLDNNSSKMIIDIVKKLKN